MQDERKRAVSDQDENYYLFAQKEKVTRQIQENGVEICTCFIYFVKSCNIFQSLENEVYSQ